ncbi:MAG: hypothetical protein NUV46_04595 [Nanoarchaeota archaeon]|nr:hypothetical protein [Nanoarchaeota archaeon]
MKKEHSEYHQEYYGKKKSHKKFFIFLFIFFALVTVVAFLALRDFNFTGEAVNSFVENETLDFQASLSIPEVNLNVNYKEVIFSSRQGSLYIDNKKILLDGSDNKVVLKGFSGIFKFDEDEIIKLDGKASEVVINSVPISLTDGGNIKVSSSSPIDYNSIEIKEGAYINNLVYITSGQILIGENLVKIKSEKVTLGDYFGSLKASGNVLTLDGRVALVKVEGISRKIVFQR